MSTLAQRARSLPRAAIWAGVGVGIVAAYFGLVEPLLDRLNRTTARAEERAAALAAVRRPHDSGDTAAEALAVRKFGRVELPGDPELRPVEFNRKVTDVFNARGVKDYKSTTRRVPLGQGPMQAAYTSSERVERTIREIQFEAEPETISAIIADLEAIPEVAAISRVQLTKANAEGRPRALRAVIAAEAWTATRRERAR